MTFLLAENLFSVRVEISSFVTICALKEVSEHAAAQLKIDPRCENLS